MHILETLISILGITVVAAPAMLFFLLGGSTLLGRPPSEETISRTVRVLIVTGLLAALAMLGLMLVLGTRHVPIELGDWVHIPHYHFHIKFVFDRLAVPFVILTFLLCGTVGAFAAKYMHREPGFTRFHVFYALFVLGMVTTSLAGTIETLFAGWEMVGLSSALLVAFYHERQGPVRNGLRVWTVYRISDAALLLAAVVLHHLKGQGDFDKFLGNDSWPEGVVHLGSSGEVLVVGLLLLLAAAGKSALVPFSGWLPRAMEGPTPSSAVFYGALSVHLGAFLLLRFSPLLDASLTLSLLVIGVGSVTAVFAATAERVQTDIKSELCFASLTQVGLIVTWIGLGGLACGLSRMFPQQVGPIGANIGIGFRYFALVHILGHGCLRTLQFLRAPSLLQDYSTLENAIGSMPAPKPSTAREWLFRFALERGYVDAILTEYIARPVVRLFEHCDAFERRWTQWLSGRKKDETDGALDDF